MNSEQRMLINQKMKDVQIQSTITHHQSPINKATGIGLISGGLDSLLAVRLLQEQGITVIGLMIETGFTTDYKWRELQQVNSDSMPEDIPLSQKLAEKLGIEMVVRDISEAFYEMLLNPRFGYGKFINPCIDCRILMLKTARELMLERNADFVFTGEVISQRPMTQFRSTLRQTEADAELEGRLLRPLSAKLLEPTIPEKEGKVDRRQLEEIVGRSRTRQLELAKKWDLSEMAAAGGGNCQLISPEYSKRAWDLFKNKGKHNLQRDDLLLLGFGRHFRLSPYLKLIISRNAQEHNLLLERISHLSRLEMPHITGAAALLDGEANETELHLAAKILGRYSKAAAGAEIHFLLSRPDGDTKSFSETAFLHDAPEITEYLI
jgi:tRNA-uridine 2-sulfurtransferase